MTPRLTGWLALAVALCMWGAANSQHLARPEVWLGLLVLAIVLEMMAVGLPEVGFVSIGVGAYAAGYLFCGWGPAVLMAGVALSVRTLARGPRDLSLRLYELLGDALVILPALAVAGLAGPYPGLVVYCLLSVFLCSRLDPAHREDAAWGRFLVVRVGAIGVALAARALAGPAALALLPLLYSLHLALVHVAHQAEPAEQDSLHMELSARKRELDASREELTRARSGLRALSAEQTLMAEMTKAIASTRDVSGALEQVLEASAQLVRARSVVVWLNQDQHLMAAAYRSPDGERLSGSALTGVVEPSVLKAWERQRPAMMRVEGHPEPIQIAFPIAGFGVLYAGREQEFSSDEQSHLALVAETSSLALAAARRNETFENELDRLSRDHRRLQQSVSQLEALLGGTRKMAMALDVQAVLQTAMDSVPALLGADRWLAVTEAGPVVVEGELGDPAVCHAVMESGKPLLSTHPGSTRMPPPLQGLRSWVAVPLAFESNPIGVLVAGSTALPMSRRQLDLFSLLAYQAAAAVTTHKLQQEVTQSSKLAAVGGLAAGLAHELNNPLGAVQLAIDLASESLDTTPKLARSSLDKASRALERSRQIVESLLLYTREARTADREPCQLNVLVQDVLEMLGPLMARSGIQVRLGLEAELPEVAGNPQELRQAVSNLVLNAKDALETAATKVLEVQTWHDGPRVFLQVADSGPGVEPGAAARIFEPFFTTKPVGKGTGLGLSITNRVAQRHGGSVRMERSQLGGASFILEVSA